MIMLDSLGQSTLRTNTWLGTSISEDKLSLRLEWSELKPMLHLHLLRLVMTVPGLTGVIRGITKISTMGCFYPREPHSSGSQAMHLE